MESFIDLLKKNVPSAILNEDSIYTFRFVFKRKDDGLVSFAHFSGNVATLQANLNLLIESGSYVDDVLLEYLGEFNPVFAGVIIPVKNKSEVIENEETCD